MSIYTNPIILSVLEDVEEYKERAGALVAAHPGMPEALAAESREVLWEVLHTGYVGNSANRAWPNRAWPGAEDPYTETDLQEAAVIDELVALAVRTGREVREKHNVDEGEWLLFAEFAATERERACAVQGAQSRLEMRRRRAHEASDELAQWEKDMLEGRA